MKLDLDLHRILKDKIGSLLLFTHPLAPVLHPREVQTVGKKYGVELTSDDVETMIRNTAVLTGKGRSSMFEDMAAGRETENRYFAGAVSRMGKQYSVPTPCCDILSILVEAKRYVNSCH